MCYVPLPTHEVPLSHLHQNLIRDNVVLHISYGYHHCIHLLCDIAFTCYKIMRENSLAGPDPHVKRRV